MVSNTAFSQILQLLQIAAGSKAQCSQAISSSAALFLRPVHHFRDSGPALQWVGYSSASGIPLLSGIFHVLLEIPVGETKALAQGPALPQNRRQREDVRRLE
jgi:hypothetical protein